MPTSPQTGLDKTLALQGSSASEAAAALTSLLKSPWETSPPVNKALSVTPTPPNLTPSYLSANEGAHRRQEEILCPEAAALNNVHLHWYSSPAFP